MLDKIFCSRLLDIRYKMRLSQESMALLVGMSHSNYAKIEEGKIKVTLGRLEHFANALKIDILYFLGRDGSYPPPQL